MFEMYLKVFIFKFYFIKIGSNTSLFFTYLLTDLLFPFQLVPKTCNRRVTKKKKKKEIMVYQRKTTNKMHVI